MSFNPLPRCRNTHDQSPRNDHRFRALGTPKQRTRKESRRIRRHRRRNRRPCFHSPIQVNFPDPINEKKGSLRIHQIVRHGKDTGRIPQKGTSTSNVIQNLVEEEFAGLSRYSGLGAHSRGGSAGEARVSGRGGQG
jgi:hypothetical protein